MKKKERVQSLGNSMCKNPLAGKKPIHLKTRESVSMPERV